MRQKIKTSIILILVIAITAGLTSWAWYTQSLLNTIEQQEQELFEAANERHAEISVQEEIIARQKRQERAERQAQLSASKVVATAYSCEGLPDEAARQVNCPNRITATGVVPDPSVTVACPSQWLGKKLYLEDHGEKVCQDTGGAITDGRVDIYLASYEEAMRFGRKELGYYFVK